MNTLVNRDFFLSLQAMCTNNLHITRLSRNVDAVVLMIRQVCVNTYCLHPLVYFFLSGSTLYYRNIAYFPSCIRQGSRLFRLYQQYNYLLKGLPQSVDVKPKQCMKQLKMKSVFCFLVIVIGSLISCSKDNEPDMASSGETGVVIDGICWATRNVDAPGTFASSPESPGMFYQWNRKKGWPSTGEVSGWDSSLPSGSSWEKSNDPCPVGWRVPTIDELGTLDYVGSTWTTLNGQTGRLFGSGSNSVFLPAAGCRINNDGTLSGAGSLGYYSSSAEFGSISARNLSFLDNYVSPVNYDFRSTGFSVRCVAK